MPLSERDIVNRTFNSLYKEMQESWKPHWRDSMDHILPRRGYWDEGPPNRGDKRNSKIYDPTASASLRVLQAGMMAGLTNPHFPWFELSTGDESLTNFGPHKKWLAHVQRTMYTIFSKSNLYRVLPTIYSEMAVTGTSAMQVDGDPDTIIHSSQDTIGTYALGQNHLNRIDTIVRKRWKTGYQLEQMFGNDRLSERTRKAIEEQRGHEWSEIRSIIEPNRENVELETRRHQDMPFRSIVWEVQAQDNEWLRKSGYDEFPIMAPRWETMSTSVYGTDCPGFMSLPDIRQLQIMTRRKGEAVEKLIRPPLNVPSGMRGQQVDLRPAGTNYVDTANVGGGITPILQFIPPVNELRIDINDIRLSIQRAFFADLFIMIINSANEPPQRTATEIASIEAEKLLMLGPVLERVFNDLLSPLIDRTFNRMLAFGLIPPPPPDLEGQDLKVDFVSTLALAQKAIGTVTIERALGFVGNMSAAWPEALDTVNVDDTVEAYFTLLRTPPEMVTPREQRDAVRQARAQAAANQAAVEASKTGAEAAKLLSETERAPNSLLDNVLSGTPPVGNA